MFTGKAANVIKKLNSMDKKTAYTWGGVILVVVISLMTLASFLGNASDDPSMDAFKARGYDLAQMPFVNDEAEQYLLASKYPDMQGNGITALYSSQDRAEREAADEEAAAQEEASVEEAAAGAAGGAYNGGGYGGGYTGSGRAGGSGAKTELGKLGGASLGRASGSGVNATFGPKGDFSNFKNQNKGNDRFVSLPGSAADAKRALSRFNTASRAAKNSDDKAANARKAMMGGNFKGNDSQMSGSGGVPLGDSKGLLTEQGENSVDVSGLDEALQDANEKAEQQNEAEKEQEKGFLARMGEWVLGMVQDGVKMYVQGKVNQWVNNANMNKSIDANLEQNGQMGYKDFSKDYKKDPAGAMKKLGWDGNGDVPSIGNRNQYLGALNKYGKGDVVSSAVSAASNQVSSRNEWTLGSTKTSDEERYKDCLTRNTAAECAPLKKK